LKKLLYLFRTFILIGSTSFGGYMSLIAMIRSKMVTRDKSIDDHFIAEGISLASMLPGPVAVNVVAYTGFHIAGLSGALVSMIAVLLPSFVFVLSLSWLYSTIETGATMSSILSGVFPVVAGLILATAISMGRKICTRWSQYLVSGFAFVLLLYFQSYLTILLILLGSAIAGLLLYRDGGDGSVNNYQRPWRPILFFVSVYVAGIVAIVWLSAGTVLGDIFKQFTYVSLTLFGGGYVMIPVLENLLVDQLAWFNHQEFIYGISVGQVTPGPILISSVFFGYKMAGVPGSIVATTAIFLPSALLMIILSNVFNSIKNNPAIQSALLGLKPAVVGMILFSALSIFKEHMNTSNILVSTLLTAITFLLVFRFNVASAVLIISGALLGFILY
jgi:chromate transporter